uniref:Uncharacterized protein n=1 Tax=Anguilla anguilla TaxID=7936 RepID=A0A0E9T253_ANGAN
MCESETVVTKLLNGDSLSLPFAVSRTSRRLF